jgi:hypothetical protein
VSVGEKIIGLCRNKTYDDDRRLFHKLYVDVCSKEAFPVGEGRGEKGEKGERTLPLPETFD